MRELINTSRELRNNRGDLYTQPCLAQTWDPTVWTDPEKYSEAERQQAKMLCRSACSRRLECIREALVPDKSQDAATQGIWGGVMFPGTFDEALNSTYDRLVEIYRVLSGTGEPPVGFKHRRRGEKPDLQAAPDKTPKPRTSRAKKKQTPVADLAQQNEANPIPVEGIVVGQPLYLFAIPA
ncbi:Uncharacterised protein [Mycolicibacterium vanbaalenii]|uniref:4Fe-4S Wbl-type domain-containing protein n=1 Tax=Mycolicibacterium vanbaalenii TaxID=110539 RepID=A0A5S9R347_MYCVN|nr:WhiB family transcriptional regulator [Mycolicibacterium vanbaalenii]CAA0126495.1 Uncharacterised protein [Mycolicibacterium vanbaalenii]